MAVVIFSYSGHLRLVDVVARQQAHRQEVDRHADRNVVDEGEPEAAQHDVPVGHAEEFRHQEGAAAIIGGVISAPMAAEVWTAAAKTGGKP